MKRSGMITGLSAAGALLAGCAMPRPAPILAPLPPALPVDQLEQVPRNPGPAPDRLRPGAETLVTLTAANAPAREMLTLLAEEAGVTLVLHPEVGGRVTFHLEDVPALEALRLVAHQAGYDLAETAPGVRAPFRPRTVFFLPPVNVNTADATTLRARFGLGRELAEWIVLSRRRW